MSCALTGIGAAASIACLFVLPGRTAQYARFDVSDLARRPERAGFSLGPLTWDLPLYARDPALEPLRVFFRAQCHGDVGLDAARCLSSRLAAAFPSGPPRHEFVDARYDPVTDFEAHMRGEPGHCVTRSGLVATILLSVSIPARQVQLPLTASQGHNVLEVWDERWEWVVIDPAYRRVAIGPDGRPESLAWAIFHLAEWQQFDKPIDDGHFYDEFARQSRRGEIAEAVFPDPWLYTRLGKRAASWPFRGLFAQTAGNRFLLGPAQVALRVAAPILIGISMACALGGAIGRRRSRVVQERDTTRRLPLTAETDAGV